MIITKTRTHILIALLTGILILLLINRFLQKPTVVNPSLPPIIMQGASPSPVTAKPQAAPVGFNNASKEYQEEQKTYIAQTPILQKLPVHSELYGIEYIDEQNLIVYSKVSDKEQAYNAAKEWFLRNNIDINNISVKFE